MSAEAAAVGTRARPEQPWTVGGVGAGLAALTRLPVGWIRAGLFVMILGTKFWLGLGIYAIAALVVPHRGGWLPGWSNVVGLLRVGSLGLIAFLSRNVAFDRWGILGQGPEVWVPIGGLLLFGWVAVLTAGRVEPSDEDRAVALAGLPALALAVVLLIVIWLAPGVRADVVLDFGLVLVGGALVLMRPPAARSAVAFVPVAALGLLAIVCAFSGRSSRAGSARRTSPRAHQPHTRATIGRSGPSPSTQLAGMVWRGARSASASRSGSGRSDVVPQDVNATVDARVGHGQSNGGPDGLYIQSFFVHRRFVAGIPLHRWQYLRPGRLEIKLVGDVCLIVRTRAKASLLDGERAGLRILSGAAVR